MKCRLGFLFFLIPFFSFSQTQTCPVNINFASGDLTHWYAYTGNNQPARTPMVHNYDSSADVPLGTRGAGSLTEYNLPSVKGIQVITISSSDYFGNFQTIPTINGYQYSYSIKLGSTSITRANTDGSGGGGYVRGVGYKIHVPAGPVTTPYTMTYAYAMVLENGAHLTNKQAFISATLRTSAGVITCASPSYTLPTNNSVDENGQGATLDSAAALRNGFSASQQPSPNPTQDRITRQVLYLQDVWTKGWTEVTFDLSPYRGQDVSLNFEADNCVPGGHFAYGYIAIRNKCAGLEISGDSLACNNSVVTYSIPALSGAVYNWDIPSSWTLISSDTSNIIRVKTSNLDGVLRVQEKNSCTDLKDTITIKTLPSPEAGNIDGSTAVCEGLNSSVLKLLNYSGSINNWLVSTDSVNWIIIPDITDQYTANNLTASSLYKVIVSKGTVCPPDTSDAAIIAVDRKTIGGNLDPLQAVLCSGQLSGQVLNLTGNRGTVKEWQFSTDGLNWSTAPSSDTMATYRVRGITENTQFRSVDQHGVCPPEVSSTATILFTPINYPEAAIFPPDTTICYGTPAKLNARINIGTSYDWNPISSAGNINSPFNLSNTVTPDSSSIYVLSVMNAGCPNALLDTFHITVLAPVIVDPGHDTSVVIGEPIQFHAHSSDAGPDTFTWFPETELSNPSIADPSAVYSAIDNIIKYTVVATTPFGCTGTGFMTVKVFKTKPDIFVPNAFTPDQGANQVFRPIPVGVSTLEYFRIYNRLGQLVFNTSSIGNGWDGTINGRPQPVGGYVWMVKGTDYTGTLIIKKGTMVLVR